MEGSSPLTRGKHPEDHAARGWPRLIPAHAGKTSSTSPTSWPTWAHPRSRGENGGHGVSMRGTRGSSPLTRGKRAGGVMPAGIGGLIPAHAGKTRVSERRVERQWAHPRSRGENCRDRFRLGLRGGSSPLTRGKRSFRGRRHRGLGLIPAHAGKTSEETVTMPPPGAHPRSRGEN